MKTRYGIAFLVIVLLSSFAALSHFDSPEALIGGIWEEVDWEFEKVHYADDRQNVPITGEQKREICSQLVIHNESLWQFDSNARKLVIGEEDKQFEILNWNIKGRGHILELMGEKGTENYQIAELTPDKLVLYFNFDLQIRGIIKMTFKRVS